MTPRDYSEERLVEHPAMELFAELGWDTFHAAEEVVGIAPTLGRQTPAAVVLIPRLRIVLQRLNPTAAREAVDIAVDELTRDRSAMSLVAANREVYALLKDGIEVSVPDRQHGGQRVERLQVIEWNDAAANDFLLVSQMTITGTLYTCRPDPQIGRAHV